MIKDKRFIEDSFPVREVSEQGAREKNIRHGHISTLHIWWARRPLATSRATNLAALIPAPKDDKERREISKFIAEFSKWENSNNKEMIEKARKMILDANDGVPPKVLDPFAGGGSIPLEALRLGCETYANDYNPVAVLIEKCTLEYPQKYGKPIPIKQYYEERPWLDSEKKEDDLFDDEKTVNPLLEDVKYWGNWVLEEARKEIGRFYPNDPDGSIPVGYIWARTVPCQNPSCNAEIPLMRQFWLAKKKNKKVSLFPYDENGEVKFKIVGDGYEKIPEDFDPSNGTISRAIVTCPICGSMIEAKTTRKLFQEGKNGERLIAIALTHLKKKGKKYRIATNDDLKIFKEAEGYLKKKRDEFIDKWGIDPMPDEYLPLKGTLGISPYWTNPKRWGNLFNTRQKLVLIIFMNKIKKVYNKILDELKDVENKKDYAKVIVTYLAVELDRLADRNSNLCRVIPQTEAIGFTYGRQALPMLWDYIEIDVGLHPSGWKSVFEELLCNLKHISQILPIANNSIPIIIHSSATFLSYPDNFLDAVFTDPPYYDNVPYSYLSDFFYVWLKRTIGDSYPDLFSTPLTPKSNEVVAYTHNKSWEEAKKFFEENLKKAFQEIYRVLKSNGIATIVYAHKTTEGWETVVNALLDSGLVITASWPLSTEMKARLRANDSAALSSSIYIVARKIEREEIGFYNDVKEELKQYLNVKLDKLWSEGIGGADFFIAAIGSAIEVFGKYKKVMDVEGNIIRANKLLEDVREIVVNYSIKQILHNGFSGEISLLTKYYILYRFNFGEARTMFDEAKKLASSLGLDLANEWNKHGFIRKEGSYIRVLGPEKREAELKEKKFGSNTELIDVLHYCLILWSKGRTKDILDLLSETGYGKKELFYRVGQAISETLSNESKEKKLLDGFLAGKEKLKKEVVPATIQEELKF